MSADRTATTSPDRAAAHTHSIHQYRHACIERISIPHTLDYLDKPSACKFIIAIQVLALSHRALVST